MEINIFEKLKKNYIKIKLNYEILASYDSKILHNFYKNYIIFQFN